MKLWQLRNPKTGENLSDPQPLPENWGPIFGLEGVKDRLGDLSWLGIDDRCWIEVEVPDPIEPVIDPKVLVDSEIAHRLQESLQFVATDNVNLTKGQRAAWLEYRRLITEIPLQIGYPNEVFWPNQPE